MTMTTTEQFPQADPIWRNNGANPKQPALGMSTAEVVARYCDDNKDAIRLCMAWLAHAHLFDDIVDGDKPVTDERIAYTEMSWFRECQFNPFWIQHRLRLIPFVDNAYNAWLDANHWEREGDHEQRRDADVIKSFYHEFVVQCALIIGGWDHMRACSRELRQYNHDFQDYQPHRNQPE